MFGEGNGNPFQYYCLENSMDRGAWWVIVRGVAKSQTQLSDRYTHTYTQTHTHTPHEDVMRIKYNKNKSTQCQAIVSLQ